MAILEKRDTEDGVPWQPGFWKRIPWSAILSLGGFLICFGAMAGILVSSNGHEVDTWPFPHLPRKVSVSSLLSLVTSVASLCLSFALTKAYAVAWWQKALKGAPLHRLHFDLSIQTSLGTILSSPCFDLFTVAATSAVAIGLIDGFLVQKSSTIGLASLGPAEDGIKVLVSNATLSPGFSQYYESATTGSSTLLTPLFSEVSRNYSNRAAINIPLAGSASCGANTTCTFHLPAAGFDVSCNEIIKSYDWLLGGPDLLLFNASVESSSTAYVKNLEIKFSTIFQPSPAQSASDDSTGCHGNTTTRQCTFRPATVAYPVTASGGTAELGAWRLGDNETVHMTTGNQETSTMGAAGPETKYGGGSDVLMMLDGILSVAKPLYEASVYMKSNGVRGGGADDPVEYSAALSTSGSVGPASNYLTSDLSSYGFCNMTWADPTTDFVNTIRELMFRSAIAQSASNTSAVPAQELTSMVTRTVSIYQSHYGYLALTFGCLFVEVIIIALLLSGWQNLGRSFSTDPLEIARAFGAPLLKNGSSNDTIENLMARVGGMHVRYGEVSDEGRLVKPMDSAGAAPHDDASRITEPNEEAGTLNAEQESLVGNEEPSTVEDENLQGKRKLVFDAEDRVGNIQRGVLY